LGLFTERLPLFFMAFAAFLAARSPLLALWLFLISYACHGLGAGVIATAWQDLIARCFPVEKRGRFFGITMFVGAGMGALSASFSAWLLDHYPFPTNFVIVFGIAAVSILVSWVFIALTKEPAQPITTPRRSNRQYWAELGHIVRGDENFRHFLIARWTYALGTLAVGFVTVAAVQRWQVPDKTVGLFTLMYLVGQTLGNLLFGLLADRFGHKLSLEVSAGLAVVAYVLAWLAPTPGWYYAVFLLLGMNLGATIVSGILIVMEFAPPEKRPTYAGLTNTTVGIVSSLAPLLGAFLAGVSYGLLFALGGVVYLVCLLLLRFWVNEPRRMAERPFVPAD
jgi:MFS family permease